jgi:hypothetical protein
MLCGVKRSELVALGQLREWYRRDGLNGSQGHFCIGQGTPIRVFVGQGSCAALNRHRGVLGAQEAERSGNKNENRQKHCRFIYNPPIKPGIILIFTGKVSMGK